MEIDAARRQEALDLARRLLTIEVMSFTSVDDEHFGKGSMTKLWTASRTDIGRVRDNNEDSRAYVLRDGALRQLTQDHSVTAELVRSGELTEREALDHPHRNVLTRVLGGGPDVEPDGSVRPTVEGDRLLVCTDGLFNDVSNDEIASVMRASEDVQAITDALVELALSRGGHDNVSVVIAEVCA